MPEYRQFRGGIFNTSKPRHGFDGITITKRDLRNRGKTWKGSLIVKRSAIFNKVIEWARDMSRGEKIQCQEGLYHTRHGIS